ncbi:hypothetical protein TB1_023521 [Malus domestica]
MAPHTSILHKVGVTTEEIFDCLRLEVVESNVINCEYEKLYQPREIVVWSSVASDQEIVAKAFKVPWNLKEVIGKPASSSFWRDNSIGKFAISHRIVRGDTVASLAVKYSV